MLRHPFKILAALLIGTGTSYAATPQSAPSLEQRIEAAKAAAQKLIDLGEETSSTRHQKVGQTNQQWPNFSNWSN